MLVDGLDLFGGSAATNFTIASGSAFPTDANTIGELFYLTSGTTPGMYIYDGSTWDPVTTGVVDFDSLNVKQAVRVATTANVNLVSGLENGDVVDGVTLGTGDRVLVKDQSTASQNGIYVVQATGAAVRSADFDGSPTTEVKAGDFAFVTEGTTQADTGWVLATNGTITVGTTALSFAQFTSSATSAAGANTQVQYNNGGQFGASANFTFSGTQLNLGATSSSFGVVGGNPNLLGNRSTFTIDGAGSSYGTDLFLRAGSANGVGASTNGGFLQLKAGNGSGSYAGGDVVISTGSSSGALGGGEYNSAIRFPASTNAGATAERMRITQTGAISFGATGTAVGTSGQVLTSAGAGSAPTWQTVAGGSFSGNTLISTAGAADATGGLAISAGGTTTGVSAPLTLTGGTSASNSNSGALTIATANPAGSGTGGLLAIRGGTATSGIGGRIDIIGGPSTNGGGGIVVIAGGSTTSGGFAGSVNINGGSVGGTGASGAGAVNIQGGNGGTGSLGGASVTVQAGNSGTAGGVGGAVNINGGTGNGASGTGGPLSFIAGIGQSGGGAIIFYTAPTTTNTERFRILNNGAWSVGTGGTATGSSGQVLTSTGATTPPTWQTIGGSFNGGTITTALTINAASNQLILGGAASAGNGTLRSAQGTSNTTGALTIQAGGTTTGASGLLTIRGGTSASDAAAGSVLITGAASVGGGVAGAVTINGGVGSTGGGTGGTVTIQAGGSGNGFTSGVVNILGGDNVTNAGNAAGAIVIRGGNLTDNTNTSNGGAVTISGGNTAGNGGGAAINIRGGTSATGSGGAIIFSTAASSTLAERLRITNTGALAFSGTANYGTAGQFLASNGNAAPTWQSVFDIIDDQRLVTAGAYSPSQLPAHSATHSFNAALSNVFEPAALTGNTTVTMTNPVGGQTVQIRFEQDATGGRVVTVPAGAKISGTPVTAASRVNWLIMTYSARASRWEGNWLEIPA